VAGLAAGVGTSAALGFNSDFPTSPLVSRDELRVLAGCFRVINPFNVKARARKDSSD
jgi:hypothetical protein